MFIYYWLAWNFHKSDVGNQHMLLLLSFSRLKKEFKMVANGQIKKYQRLVEI